MRFHVFAIIAVSCIKKYSYQIKRMDKNAPEDNITHVNTISNRNHCIVNKVADKYTLYAVKVKKRMRDDEIQFIKSIMARSINFKEDSKRSINLLRNYVGQFNMLTYQLLYYQQHNLLEQAIEYERKRKEALARIVETVFRGQSLYLYTYENMFYNRNSEKLIFNPTSTAGLLSIIAKRNFTKEQFKQIYQLVSIQMFEEVQDRWSLVTYKTKFRAIAMFILHIIFGRRVTLLKDSDLKQEQISFQQAKKLVEKIPDRFKKLLRGKGILEKIKKAGEVDRVNYLLFLRRVFEDNCKDLGWKQVVNMLFNPYKPKTEKNLSNFFYIFAQRLFHIEDEFSRAKLIQLGLAKKVIQYAPASKEIISSKIILQDSDLYLHFLLSAASFNFKSVADQISQQKYNNIDNDTIFNQMAILIRKLLASHIYFELIQLQYKLQSIYCNFANLPGPKNNLEKSLKKIQQTCLDLGFQRDLDLISYTDDSTRQQIVSPLTGKALYQPQMIIQVEVQSDDSFNEYYQSVQKIQVEESSLQSQPVQKCNQILLQPEYRYVLEKMVRNFKTHIAQVNSSKIIGLDSKMNIIGKYLRL